MTDRHELVNNESSRYCIIKNAFNLDKLTSKDYKDLRSSLSLAMLNPEEKMFINTSLKTKYVDKETSMSPKQIFWVVNMILRQDVWVYYDLRHDLDAISADQAQKIKSIGIEHVLTNSKKTSFPKLN